MKVNKCIRCGSLAIHQQPQPQQNIKYGGSVTTVDWSIKYENTTATKFSEDGRRFSVI